MKKCPQCKAVYPDDLAFCLEDGSSLLVADEPETLILPNPHATDPQSSVKTRENISSSPNQPVKRGVSPIFAYLTVALLALLVGGGTVGYLMSRDDLPKAANQNNKQNQSEKISREAVQNLINDWEKAQDTRNFAAYKDCYDTSLTGIKRTVSGSTEQFNYTEWLNDRQKMMSQAKFLEVGVDKLRISIDADIATAEFDQTFRTTGYADFGPKILKIKMTTDGAKIFYEELRSATKLPD